MRLSGRKIQHYIKPMLATSVDSSFNSDEWLFELKLDGYRAIADTRSRKPLLYSRNGLDFSTRYIAIVEALQSLKQKAVFDGEVVVLNSKGNPDFQALQHYGEDGSLPLVYYVFDILILNKKELGDLPLVERKKILKKVLPKSTIIHYCDHIEERGKEFFRSVKKVGIEGIMAKRKDSVYLQGVRTKDWLKIKNQQSQEAIIIGFTEPKGARQQFGSLLLAEYRRNKLHYIGHAGTGFSESTLKELMQKMKPLITSQPPLKEPVPANGKVTWLKPSLVCEVGYTEVTRGGALRHPVYKSLRPDKRSKLIREETEKPVPVKKIVHELKS